LPIKPIAGDSSSGRTSDSESQKPLSIAYTEPNKDHLAEEKREKSGNMVQWNYPIRSRIAAENSTKKPGKAILSAIKYLF